MSALKTIAIASTLFLAACVPATDENGATAVDMLVGKTLEADNGTIFLFNPDGTVGGQLAGATIVGTYTANAREICSTYRAPAGLAGQATCSVPRITGNVVVFERRDGSTSQPYVIRGQVWSGTTDGWSGRAGPDSLG